MQKTIQLSALAIVIALAIPQVVEAHGFEGERFFPPTIQTDDPFASDELALPTIRVFNNPATADAPKTREIDTSVSFTKEIFPKFALSVSGTYINLEPDKHTGDGGDPAPSQDGFDNISLNAKYQVWENPEHEFLFSIGANIDLGGTGSKPLGVNSYSTYTPTVYWGKGFGDLPNELKYLKPLALTGTAGFSIPGKTLESNSLGWGLALEYSLLYLQEHVEDVGLPHPFKEMIPLVEFSMDSPLNRSGETTTGTVNPGILWEGKYCQVGAEAVIPVNAHTGPDVGAVIQVQIFIDDLFPKVFGHPLFFPEDNK